MRLNLSFLRLLMATRLGLMAHEIAERLEVSTRTAHRLVKAAELAGCPLFRDDRARWRILNGGR